jgi:hypothetical protein
MLILIFCPVNLRLGVKFLLRVKFMLIINVNIKG